MHTMTQKTWKNKDTKKREEIKKIQRERGKGMQRYREKEGSRYTEKERRTEGDVQR